MAVPKKRTTPRKQGTRRSHLALKLSLGSKCSNCGAPVASHHACSKCGFYKGKQAVKV